MREKWMMNGSRKDAREMDDERLAQGCARREQWKARARMREKWMMNGSRKDAREMDDGRLAQGCARREQWKARARMRENGTMEGTKSRHRMPGNGHTKETYERDGTEMSVMRTRCERFRPGKVER